MTLGNSELFVWSSKHTTAVSEIEHRASDLRASLFGPSIEERVRAAHSLACAGHQVRLWDIAALRHAMQDEHEDVRGAAIRALGIIARNFVGNRLRHALARALDGAHRDPSPQVRETAVRTIREAARHLRPNRASPPSVHIEYEAHVDTLLELEQDEAENVRHAASRAIDELCYADRTGPIRAAV